MERELEYSLIHLSWEPAEGEEEDLARQLVEAFCRGRWEDILTDTRTKHYLQPEQQPQGRRPIITLTLAATLLSLYLQTNFTGPPLHADPIQSIFAEQAESFNSASLQQLALAGEPAYHLTKSPGLLRIAIDLIDQLSSTPAHQLVTLPWWNLRAQVLRRRLLDHPVPIPQQLFLQLDHLSQNFLQPVHSSAHLDHHLDLLPRLTLEIGLAHHLTNHHKRANAWFTKAVCQAQLEYQLTGIPGKRTKFQENEFSQLVVLAQSRLRLTDQSTAPIPVTLPLNDDTLMEKTQFTQSVQSSSLPIDPSNQPVLHPLDQALLLALSLSIKNTSPNHGLTQSQISPFIERVLENPTNWSIHSMALLIRSRLECHRTRTVERSLLQLQALVDQLTKDAENDPVDQSTGLERVRWTWSLALPSSWELERELAQKLSGLGVTRSALEIFERLEMWEHVIQCYMNLGLKNQGSQLVKELIEEKKIESDLKNTREEKRRIKDPKRVGKLWCLLAELESNPNHWETAWKVSENTSSRAMRSLGAHYFMKNEYPKAKECLSQALKINPLFNQTCFIYGCAGMRTDDWDLAETAFRRCVNLDDEDAESWNNLATVYLKQATLVEEAKDEEDTKDEFIQPLLSEEDNEPTGGEKRSKDEADFEPDEEEQVGSSKTLSRPMAAFHALQRAIKISYDSWKMHTNYMIVAMSVGEYMEAIRALGRLVEIRGEEGLDIPVMTKLIDHLKSSISSSPTATENEPNQQQQEEESIKRKKRKKLLERLMDTMDNIITIKCPNSSNVWEFRSDLSELEKNYQEAIKYQLNAYRVGVSQREIEWINPPNSVVWEDTAHLVLRTCHKLIRFKSSLLSNHQLDRGIKDISNSDDDTVKKFVKQLDWNLLNLSRNFLSKSSLNFSHHPLFLQLNEIKF